MLAVGVHVGDPQVLGDVDLVVVVGRKAKVPPVDGLTVETWDTDEPSERGIDGIERMELIRDDIASRVNGLATRLLETSMVEDNRPSGIAR